MKSLRKHNQGKTFSLLVLFLVIVILATGCAPASPATAPAAEADPVQGNNSEPDYTGKKVLWVDSYHEGYAWTDAMEAGMRDVLDGTGVELKIIHMDTKQNPGDEFGQAAALAAKAEVDAFKPDVVIASEDNVQKLLIVPYFKGSELPIVFNGVNWDISPYGYPANNITGMVEVELADQLINLLKAHAKGERIGYLTIETETERKGVEIINNRFFADQMQVYWATTQDEFKDAFIAAQQEVDILFIGNNAGSKTWDDAEMQQFILSNTTIPTGAVRDWMAPYALLTLAKSGKEQGEWVAQTTLRILDGTPVSDIPIVENKKGEMIVNLEIADKLGVVFAPSLLKNAVLLGQ